MPSVIRHLLIAVCAWEACVISFFFAAIALYTNSSVWDTDNLVHIAGLAIWGLLVVGIVALLSRRLGKIGGAIVGLLCGLLPTTLMLAWVFIERPGFEGSAGAAAVAVMLAAPSVLGGALAGIICSGRKNTPVT